ncbi:MAG: hypothetical protein A3H39_13170 [candidate division NC10 bacterium RIFCSPLOWO2_02_FULL_66_22]|nr:MAG: hypothetical protein A3H39_13170 [candidate division NC10 bacterium RIFCSPLOWO2_02_FULL_66_22]
MNKQNDHVFYRDLTRAYPVVDRAEGVHIWDKTGKRYLDATGGAVVVGIGHAVPEVLAAMFDQARRVCYAYNYQFTSEAQQDLAAELADFAPGDLNYVYFVSGGSEGTETAIKLARSYFLERGQPGKYKVISRWRGYHGNTLGALSASGNVLRRRDYGPYLLDFKHISPPYCYRCFFGKEYPSCGLACAKDLERCILQEGPEQVAAFITETVGGASVAGMMPPPEYFPLVREICDRYQVLLINDEVLCGVGRTGRNCAIDHWSVVPDMIVCAKGLSSGYSPIGAVIVREKVYETISEGSGAFEHGFTFGGNPLSCAVGLAVLRYIRKNDLVKRAADMGDYLLGQLKEELRDLPIVGDISGKGLLVGVELVQNREDRQPIPRAYRASKRVVSACFERGVIVLAGSGGQADGVNGDRLEIAPPYVIDPEDVDLLVSTLKDAVTQVGDELLTKARGKA